MKTRKIVSLVLIAALMLYLLAGCGKKEAPVAVTETPAEADGVTVTDMKGRTVTLDAPAERIVALTAADCEILCAIGCGDKLVGRGAYCDYPAEVLEIPAVESGSVTNIEQIIALDPDVVLMADMEQTVEQVNALEAAGIAVVVSDAEDLEGTYTAIALIGELMGRDAEAAGLIDSMKATFAELSEKSAAAGLGEKTVYFEVSPLEWGLWTAGKGTFMDEISEMLHLTNCFADVDGWAAVSEEQVLSRNPDYIVTVAMSYEGAPSPIEEICSRTGWENLTAVKETAILNLSNDELTRPGPRLADGAKQLFELVYGAEG